MSHTRTGIPLWVYYQDKAPIFNLNNVREGNIYFTLERGSPCHVVYIVKTDLSENTITVRTLQENKEKIINLYKFQQGRVKFYENEIDT